MHKIETILFGIAMILFGIASILISNFTGWEFFEILGVLFPVLGLAAAVIGVFDKGYSKKDENDEEE